MPQPPRKKARLSRDEEEEEQVTELPEDGEEEEEAPVGDDEDDDDGDFAAGGGDSDEGNESEEEEGTPDLYAVLGIENTASAEEIKRAYKKAALACHPDRNSDEDATAEFQLVNQAYAVLSNPARRKRYDTSGEVDEDPILFANKSAGQTWEDYFKTMFVTVTGEAIKDFAAKYRESEEEKQDVLKYYEEFEGDMEQVLENVMLSTEDDYERFCKIISDAIKAKKVKDYPEFHNKLSFDKEAIAAEAEAAQKALDKMEQKKMMRDLKNEIAVRGKQKFDNLVNNLMDKYKDDEDDDDEDRDDIDDAAFAKTQTQILGKRKRGAQ